MVPHAGDVRIHSGLTRMPTLPRALVASPPYAVLPLGVQMQLRRAALGKETVDSYYAEEGEKVLAPVVKFLARHGVQLKTVTKVGPAGETIAKVAESGKYDLIVMGTHGHGSLGKLVMGSVSTQVLANCQVPVLLVR